MGVKALMEKDEQNNSNVISKKLIAIIIAFIAIGFAYLLFFEKFEIGIPCIFRVVTGYKCPGCGMTHAMVAIWQGDFAKALDYNLLSLTILPLVVIYLIYRFLGQRKNKNRPDFYAWEFVLLIITFIIVVGYGVMRNI